MKKEIYLDYAATTPIDPEVEAAMRPYFLDEYGNPGSLHALGQRAQVALDAAREKIAHAIGANWREIIFTGGATEADNLAVFGVVRAVTAEAHKTNPDFVPHIITSTVEHKAILEPCAQLEKEGLEVTYITVGKEGTVNPRDVEAALKENTVLVSIMYANNEIGTIQPLTEIAQYVRNFRERNSKFQIPNSKFPYTHTDAVQAFQYLDCNIGKLGVDLMTLSAHKIYGPKGIGALYMKKGTPLAPLIMGGGQEEGRRGGTENVPAIVGFAKSAEIAAAMRERESKRLHELQEYMINELEGLLGTRVRINGAREPRLPNNINIRIVGVPADTLLISLDQEGIYVSSGSACTARAVEPSHVILALGHTREDAKQSIRFSMGRHTTKEDIEYVLEKLTSHVERIIKKI